MESQVQLKVKRGEVVEGLLDVERGEAVQQNNSLLLKVFFLRELARMLSGTREREGFD